MAKIITMGEIMLRLSTPGNSRFIQTDCFDAVYGGGEANVAVSCANYGHQASFITRLPAHEIGQAAVNALRRYGVDTSYTHGEENASASITWKPVPPCAPAKSSMTVPTRPWQKPSPKTLISTQSCRELTGSTGAASHPPSQPVQPNSYRPPVKQPAGTTLPCRQI